MTTYIFLTCAYGALAAYHANQLHHTEGEVAQQRSREQLRHDLVTSLIYATALAIHPLP